jgi:hypothetical protein
LDAKGWFLALSIRTLGRQRNRPKLFSAPQKIRQESQLQERIMCVTNHLMDFSLDKFLFPGVVSAATALLVHWVKSRSDDQREIRADIRKMIELAMAYPHVEDASYMTAWKSGPERSNKDDLIYDNYCCFVFNLLERIWMFCGGNEKKMQRILHVTETIEGHSKWWYAERENADGYDKGFIRYVDQALGGTRNDPTSHSD